MYIFFLIIKFFIAEFFFYPFLYYKIEILIITIKTNNFKINRIYEKSCNLFKIVNNKLSKFIL